MPTSSLFQIEPTSTVILTVFKTGKNCQCNVPEWDIPALEQTVHAWAMPRAFLVVSQPKLKIYIHRVHSGLFQATEVHQHSDCTSLLSLVCNQPEQDHSECHPQTGSVWWMRVNNNSLLSSILTFLMDLKRIPIPHSFFRDFRADKTFTACWSGCRLQVWVPACHLTLTPKGYSRR